MTGVNLDILSAAELTTQLIKTKAALSSLVTCTADVTLSPHQREVWVSAERQAYTDIPRTWPEMSQDADTHSFLCAVVEASSVGRRAISEYGRKAQTEMCIEECGELITSIAQMRRGRIEQDEVINEAADAMICILQLGAILGSFSLRELTSAVEQKTARLSARLDAVENGRKGNAQ